MPATKSKPRRTAAPKAPPKCLACLRPIEPRQADDAVAVFGLTAHGECWERAQAEIAAKADAMPAFQTVCEGCHEWTDRIMYRTPDGKRLCEKCAPVEVVTTVTDSTLLGLRESADCWCGLPAARRCQGCQMPLCEGHWNKHSHRAGTNGPPVWAAGEIRV